MKKIFLLFCLILSFSNFTYAGSAKSSIVKQTQIPYEECINRVYFDTDALYKTTKAEVVKRKNNQVILKHVSRAGTSHYEAEEASKINTQEAVFETKMVKPIDGTLKNQTTIIKIKNINEKAHITIIMEADVDHFLASNKAVKNELDGNIQNILSQIEKDR